MKQCTVLFSGGIDSTTALFWALNKYKITTALTFDYSQKHKIEIQLAKKLIRSLNVSHEFLSIDLKQIGGSSLTSADLPIPEYERLDDIKDGLPSTYVPFRNGIFLAVATAWAESHNSTELVCGFNILDSPNYPDTQEKFVKAMEKAINLGTKALFTGDKIKIITPFIQLKKSGIIKMGLSLGADYSYSISCYSGKERPCMRCSSCLLRQRAWEEVGLEDPLIMRLKKEGKT